MTYSVRVSTANVLINESNHVEVEEIVRLFLDDKELTSVVRRYVIAPEDDIANLKSRASAFADLARKIPSDEAAEAVVVKG